MFKLILILIVLFSKQASANYCFGQVDAVANENGKVIVTLNGARHYVADSETKSGSAVKALALLSREVGEALRIEYENAICYEENLSEKSISVMMSNEKPFSEYDYVFHESNTVLNKTIRLNKGERVKVGFVFLEGQCQSGMKLYLLGNSWFSMGRNLKYRNYRSLNIFNSGHIVDVERMMNDGVEIEVLNRLDYNNYSFSELEFFYDLNGSSSYFNRIYSFDMEVRCDD